GRSAVRRTTELYPCEYIAVYFPRYSLYMVEISLAGAGRTRSAAPISDTQAEPFQYSYAPGSRTPAVGGVVDPSSSSAVGEPAGGTRATTAAPCRPEGVRYSYRCVSVVRNELIWEPRHAGSTAGAPAPRGIASVMGRARDGTTVQFSPLSVEYAIPE